MYDENKATIERAEGTVADQGTMLPIESFRGGLGEVMKTHIF